MIWVIIYLAVGLVFGLLVEVLNGIEDGDFFTAGFLILLGMLIWPLIFVVGALGFVAALLRDAIRR